MPLANSATHIFATFALKSWVDGFGSGQRKKSRWSFTLQFLSHTPRIMKFPRFWARVSNPRGTVVARGWSENSLEEATARAQERLQRILHALNNRRSFELGLERYVYEVDSVICEEVIQRISHNAQEIAVISRNAYGSLILNARRMMFVDVDFPPPPRIKWLARLFSRKSDSHPDPQRQTLERLRQWQASNAQFTLRLYRTYAGIRAIVVNRSFDSVDEGAIALMTDLHCDELYVRLCQSQACFRARLNPKPWRVGMKNPPAAFPFGTDADRQAFQTWLDEKTSKSESFSVCEFLETLGSGELLEEHRPLVELHDSYCCHTEKLPLA